MKHRIINTIAPTEELSERISITPSKTAQEEVYSVQLRKTEDHDDDLVMDLGIREYREHREGIKFSCKKFPDARIIIWFATTSSETLVVESCDPGSVTVVIVRYV